MAESNLLEGGDQTAVSFPSRAISILPTPTEAPVLAATPVVQTAALSAERSVEPNPVARPLFAVPLPAQFSGPSKRDDLALAEFGMKPIEGPVQALMSKRAEDLSAQELVQILARYQLRNNPIPQTGPALAGQQAAKIEVGMPTSVKASGFRLEEYEIPTPEMKD